MRVIRVTSVVRRHPRMARPRITFSRVPMGPWAPVGQAPALTRTAPRRVDRVDAACVRPLAPPSIPLTTITSLIRSVFYAAAAIHARKRPGRCQPATIRARPATRSQTPHCRGATSSTTTMSGTRDLYFTNSKREKAHDTLALVKWTCQVHTIPETTVAAVWKLIIAQDAGRERAHRRSPPAPTDASVIRRMIPMDSGVLNYPRILSGYGPGPPMTVPRLAGVGTGAKLTKYGCFRPGKPKEFRTIF